MTTKRAKDIKIVYRTDTGNRLIVSVRTFVDENGEYITPITATFLAHRSDDQSIKGAINATGNRRALETIVVNGDANSDATIIVPANPSDIENSLKQQIQEVRAVTGNHKVISINYRGESATYKR